MYVLPYLPYYIWLVMAVCMMVRQGKGKGRVQLLGAWTNPSKSQGRRGR